MKKKTSLRARKKGMSSTSDELKKIDEERRIQEQVIELKRKEQEEAAKQDEQLVKEARQTIRYIQRHYLTSLDHAIQWFVYMCHEDLLNLIFVVRRSLRWAVLAKLYNLVEWPDGNRRTAMFWEFVKDDLKHESTRIRVLNLIIDFFHLSNHHLTEEKTEKNITIKKQRRIGWDDYHQFETSSETTKWMGRTSPDVTPYCSIQIQRISAVHIRSNES